MLGHASRPDHIKATLAHCLLSTHCTSEFAAFYNVNLAYKLTKYLILLYIVCYFMHFDFRMNQWRIRNALAFFVFFVIVGVDVWYKFRDGGDQVKLDNISIMCRQYMYSCHALIFATRELVEQNLYFQRRLHLQSSITIRYTILSNKHLKVYIDDLAF